MDRDDVTRRIVNSKQNHTWLAGFWKAKPRCRRLYRRKTYKLRVGAAMLPYAGIERAKIQRDRIGCLLSAQQRRLCHAPGDRHCIDGKRNVVIAIRERQRVSSRNRM